MSDGLTLHNVHVAVQVGSQPVGLVRGDADMARWEVDVRAAGSDGGVDLRGPAVHGKRGERLFYLTWDDVVGTLPSFGGRVVTGRYHRSGYCPRESGGRPARQESRGIT